MEALQQNEELWQDLQRAVGGTPFLKMRMDSDGFQVFSSSGDRTLRLDADGFLIPSDDLAKPAGTIAMVAGPEILLYKV